MKPANPHSPAVMLLCVAAISSLGHRVQADTPTSAKRSGCSHLRYSAVPIAARDGTPLFASDLNNKGEVVGVIGDGSNDVFLWKEGAYVRLIDRIFPGALQITVAAINDRTQIVGEFTTPDFNIEEYLLSKGGVNYLVGNFEFPQEINDHGEITGMAFGDGLVQGAVWRNGETVLLPMAPGHTGVNTVDINNKGTVVGFGGANGGNAEALVWFAPYTSAPTVIPLPANTISSASVVGVNNRDEVIFRVALDPDPSEPGGDFVRSYVWSAGRPLQALEPLPGYVHSSAFDINSADLIVGHSTSASGEFNVATLWRGEQICALQDLVTTPGLEGQLTSASRINERGEILAGGFVLRPTQAHH
jgi:uncharacterized membrane protein